MVDWIFEHTFDNDNTNIKTHSFRKEKKFGNDHGWCLEEDSWLVVLVIFSVEQSFEEAVWNDAFFVFLSVEVPVNVPGMM